MADALRDLKALPKYQQSASLSVKKSQSVIGEHGLLQIDRAWCTCRSLADRLVLGIANACMPAAQAVANDLAGSG